MPSPKYPLESLLKLRGRRVDQAADALARASREREGAERMRAAAEGAREAHRRAATRVRRVERDALEAGELRAADLGAADAWHTRTQAEDDTLATRVGSASARESEARTVEQQSRERLAMSARDAELVERHHEKWDDARRKDAEAREEDASFEAWRPKR
jgi:hypothetical protein